MTMTRPRLKGQAQDLLLEHFCTNLRSVDDLQRTMQDMSLDESMAGRSSRGDTTTDSSTKFLRFLLSSKSNLQSVRRFLYSATFKLYPTKCYLMPPRFQELMLDTEKTIAILELVRPQNLQLYIDSDEITLMRFAQFEDHLQDVTRLHLEFIRLASTSKFERIIKKIATQLRELECPATTLSYISFNPSHPVMNLERLRLQYLSNTDPVEIQHICKHNIKHLHLVEVSGNELAKQEVITPEQAGQQTLEELTIHTSSLNAHGKVLSFVNKLREQMPRMHKVEVTTTEMYKESVFAADFIKWTLERYNRFRDFQQQASSQIRRLTIKTNIIKVLQHEEESIPDWIRLLKETPEFAQATFNEHASVGDEFASLEYREPGFLMSFQIVAMSALSGSFMAAVENA